MSDTHEFKAGSGPLPDSDPEACDECGEVEDHRNHHVPEDLLGDLVALANEAADLGSNDDEIEALNDALDCALSMLGRTRR